MSGIQFYAVYYFGGIAALFSASAGLSERIWMLVLFLILCCPLLPVFNTASLALFEAYHPRQAFTITTWCLAIGAGILGALLMVPQHFWGLWGLWLFIGLAISALMLEILVLVSQRKGRLPS
jgi:hypothetical protein